MWAITLVWAILEKPGFGATKSLQMPGASGERETSAGVSMSYYTLCDAADKIASEGHNV
jgi:hypothetical protein